MLTPADVSGFTASRCGFEPLEPRRLLSAAIDDGVLVIEGTAASDRISVQLASRSRILVNENGRGTLFNLVDIDSIRIETGAGNDRVAISARLTLDTSINGGSGHDTLIGGGGNDILVGAAGNDLLNAIDGDSTNDELLGGAGADRLHGDARFDVFDGGDGLDRYFNEFGVQFNREFDPTPPTLPFPPLEPLPPLPPILQPTFPVTPLPPAVTPIVSPVIPQPPAVVPTQPPTRVPPVVLPTTPTTPATRVPPIVRPPMV